MKSIAIILLATLSAIQVFAQKNLIQASFYQVPFYHQTEGPYIETYTSIFGNSIHFKEIGSNQFQGDIEVLYLISKDSTIVDYKKINLRSPILQSDSLAKPNFLDVQRFFLPAGTYTLTLRMIDRVLPSDTTRLDYPFTIESHDQMGAIQCSGTQWVEHFEAEEGESILHKNAYKIIPYVSNFFPANANQLSFYKEIYFHPDSFEGTEQFLLKYYIEKYETQTPLTAYNQFKRISVKPVQVVFSKFDISKLASGNYTLVIDIRNKDNELIFSNRSLFQRSNPGVGLAIDDVQAVSAESTFASRITSIDSLKYYLDALYPISAVNEVQYVENLLRTDDIDKMQQFFFYFWNNRNAENPEKEWLNYKGKLDRVNLSYSTQVRKGYQTDRGRVYLTYGEPNVVARERYLPDTLPFEIWQYYELEGFRDRKFLFYNPHRQWNTYELLHSNMIRELKNENWLLQLYDYYNPLGSTESLKYDLKSLRNSDYGMRVLRLWDNP